MAATQKIDVYEQALELVRQLHAVNKYEVDEEVAEWLASESEINADSPSGQFNRIIGRIYEGMFNGIQSMREIGPELLWGRAQDKVRGESYHAPDTAQKEKIPIIHWRLLRLYWMVRLAAEELIEQKPRTRLGKVLIEVEHDLREAFVETKEGVKLPLAMRRKKQWDLLADFGMGLTVDQIYDLRPPRYVIHWNTGEKLWLGIIVGIVIGFVLGVMLLWPSGQ
jgi:hypothetical protein